MIAEEAYVRPQRKGHAVGEELHALRPVDPEALETAVGGEIAEPVAGAEPDMAAHQDAP